VLLPSSRGVEAPGATACYREIEEDEAIEDRRITPVQGGKETSRCVRHEIGDRHVAAEDEGDGPREEADDDQDAAKDLDATLDSREG
jgi:hypothetical protein